MADWDPTTCNDAGKLRSFMANVKEKRPDLYEKAFRQLAKVEGKNVDDPIEVEFWKAVAALEQIYLEESGRRKRASRIRAKVEKDGVRETLAYLALKKEASDGFVYLAEAGLAELTAEHIIVRFAGEFSDLVVEAAKHRLTEHDVPVPAAA